MKKLLVFASLACLVLASCTPVSGVGGLVPIAPVANPTAIVPQTGGSVPPAATPLPQAAAPVSQAPVPVAKNGLPNFDHIVLIMLENKPFNAINGPHMTQLENLSDQNVLLSNYYAITHPSLPNYIALMSGSTQGITSDCDNCFVNQPNLADEIEASGRTWKAYLEGMPTPCFVGNSGKYVQKHNPLLYFDSIRLNAARCDRSILPLTSLDGDLADKTLPNFSYIMPDLCNSGHDCSAATADKWVGAMVAKLQASPALGKNSLIVVAFDEGSAQGSGGGQVAVLLISPTALPDLSDNTSYTHYSLLKTILAAWKLPELGQTAQAQPISVPWTGQAGQASIP